MIAILCHYKNVRERANSKESDSRPSNALMKEPKTPQPLHHVTICQCTDFEEALAVNLDRNVKS